MLVLAGLGLEKGDISLRSLDYLKRCGAIYFDSYTSFVSGEYLSFLSDMLGKAILPIERNALEDRVWDTIKAAKSSDIGILVGGDPLIATTHKIIIAEAQRHGIETVVLHSSSVFSAAIGESGLDFYRFGPTVTLPFWSENYRPISFLKNVERNLENGEHTLLLLDIRKPGTPMTLAEAAEILGNAIKASGGNRLETIRFIVMADAGKDSAVRFSATLDEMRIYDGSRLAGKALCIIVPASISFAEKEALVAAGIRGY
jgi:diphthine synthase